ncbi:sterol 3-beta-glucosyltransferase UGT80B1-like isoform X1 [Macadamia integrifolia]|uniref:sterol 3-beta-glucosyltransferase UGT80B1-like isoform X1 n=2 Tax=Macadamia integrifolia TaxID=60698 RepID=UPI001C527AA3|nr:sterol 3-beta-glucosyltransferase UGT80B1-like isoform X1 [Macadamia integrifolia]XP_042481247.1 sterol 3-beta-glucosyltransferase UGT80B1-like isoform X1 [Macadamia integrifolia]
MESTEIVPSRKDLEGESITSQVVEAVGQAVCDVSMEGRALPSPEKQSTSDSPHVAKDEQSYMRYSSDVEIFQSEDVGSSPHRSLEHFDTAPVVGHKDLSVESPEALLFRSKTEKKESSKRDLKLDRLSESEKKKLIVNLVKIQNDGTVEVDMARSAPVASELLELDAVDQTPPTVEDSTIGCNKSIPILKIAILVVGTRGDVQPFLAMAKRLQEFGHHVRLATHANFCNFVRSAGIEFYPLGGDPRVLARYMARSKGFLPSAPGEISLQRKQMKAIINSLLPACTEPDLDTGAPFRAQAIIANPPAYGHAHVAEGLGVPLHIFFTMPWTPTHEFPHPLARVSQAAGYRLSYFVVDLLIWWGIGGFVNEFRKRKLKLAPIAYFSTYHGSISHLPTGYMWSPHLVPKPNDWGPLVDVVGFCFLNLGATYQPQKEFTQWLQDGPKPIYIGFGSMPLEDAQNATNIILKALKDTGQRGIIGRGWGDLGILEEASENVFLLEDCPHDWLFPQCSAVVHHGGAGTTATGLRAGCPTTIVPFFGDQFFWGDRVHQIGVGPAQIPISELTIESLSNAITFMLQPEVKARAMELAKKIENEDGVAAAVDVFHRHLPEELPMPTSLLEENDQPYLLQWLFEQVEKVCCLPCS